MVERIPQHKHCKNCDKAISVDKEYCNEICRSTREMAIRAKKRQLVMFYLVMIIVFIVAILLSV